MGYYLLLTPYHVLTSLVTQCLEQSRCSVSVEDVESYSGRECFERSCAAVSGEVIKLRCSQEMSIQQVFEN